MTSEKIIIQLKDLSKIYQMGEEISITAIPSQYSHIFIKSPSRSYTIFAVVQ